MNMVCVECGAAYDGMEVRYYCECGGMLDLVHDWKAVDGERLKRLFEQRLSQRMTPYASGVWRYKELIYPELDERHIVTKYEGNTGLYASEPVRAFAGVRKLWLKAQSENPSGSFKDNGMTVAVSHGRTLGFRRFTCASTGNTSSSLAMYTALADSEAVVFVPGSDISPNKVLQTQAYGAKVFAFDGTYDDGIRFYGEYGDRLGMYICNSINPFRIEGQKSIVYEMAQSLSWQLPDWIILPGGALSNATALGKGLQDLYTLGFISRLPRVAVVQAEGASPFHDMCSRDDKALTARVSPYTRATAMNIGNPPSWKKAYQYTIEQTNGVTVSVSDQEIFEAKAVVDRSGIGCEPASAASVAGLKKLVAEDVIHPEETAACILTGNVLKDTDALREYHMDAMWNGQYANPVHHAALTLSNVQALLSGASC